MSMAVTRPARTYDPAAVAVYTTLHLGCLLVFVAGNPWLGIKVGVASYFLRIFALTASYHRYFAHRSYQTSRVFQFLLGLYGLLTIQRGPLWWAATHRTHHRFSDTPDDLHSPHHQGFFYSHSLWFLDRRNVATDMSVVKDLAKFPELRLLDNQYVFLPLVAAFVGGLYWAFGLTGVAWGFFVSTVLIHHTTHWVQSFSHTWGGYRRFPTTDHSRNHWWLGIVSLGEFHNNHHYRPGSAKQGAVWWEFDLTWHILKLLEKCGIVWSLRDLVSEPRKSGPPA